MGCFAFCVVGCGTQVARDVFEHLHELELQYHLNRSTGAVSRVIDRGSRWVRSRKAMVWRDVVGGEQLDVGVLP